VPGKDKGGEQFFERSKATVKPLEDASSEDLEQIEMTKGEQVHILTFRDVLSEFKELFQCLERFLVGWTPPNAEVKWAKKGVFDGRPKLRYEKPKPLVKFTYHRKNYVRPKTVAKSCKNQRWRKGRVQMSRFGPGPSRLNGRKVFREGGEFAGGVEARIFVAAAGWSQSHLSRCRARFAGEGSRRRSTIVSGMYLSRSILARNYARFYPGVQRHRVVGSRTRFYLRV
jgi:hypothetical protein